MIIFFAGSRTINDYELFKAAIAESRIEIDYKNDFVMHGAHWEGWDVLAQRWAKENGFFPDRCLELPAQWKKYGKTAGPFRNAPMARICDFAIIGHDGKSTGTAGVLRLLRELKKPFYLKTVDV